jgi:hypothetical protein
MVLLRGRRAPVDVLVDGQLLAGHDLDGLADGLLKAVGCQPEALEEDVGVDAGLLGAAQ